MDYNEYLSSLGKWNSKSGYELDAIRDIMALFNNPQDNKPSIHVTGTNGKGSVGVMTASILAQSGLKVGYSCSPHLSRVNERIIINGKEIPDEELLQLCKLLKGKLDSLDLKPSFFEVMTAISFLAFQNLDFAVYEVGLGGRLDATNILKKPKVSIITSIALDHEKLLGNSIEAICKEKVGIMREASIMVVGSLSSSCMEIIDQKAKAMKTKVLALGRDFFVEEISDRGLRSFKYRDLKQNQINFTPSLRGFHQGQNAALAIASCIELNIPLEECAQGVNSVYWPGRLEFIKYKYRDLILDCAHNPAGTEKLTSFLDSEGIKEIDIIYASLDTKNWQQSIQALSKHIVNWGIVEVDSEMRVKGEDVLNALKSLDIMNITNYGRKIDDCLNQLCNVETSRPLLITGSMYLLGEIRTILKASGVESLQDSHYWKLV